MNSESQQSKINSKVVKLTPYDLKSKASKYKRWTPKMDQFLVKLLSDVVHSYPKDGNPQLNKKTWSYICNQLRIANPETVYSTYTKYSCQQHLFHVIHTRYKLWYTLMLHRDNSDPNVGYSFKWNPTLGNFQIITVADNQVLTNENIIKSIIYGETLPLPPLDKFYKANVVVNDFFLSDNYLYMSDYHNEVLPMLVESDPRYLDGLGNVYDAVPKFEYEGFNREYMKPLQMRRVKRNETKFNTSVVPLDYNTFQQAPGSGQVSSMDQAVHQHPQTQTPHRQTQARSHSNHHLRAHQIHHQQHQQPQQHQTPQQHHHHHQQQHNMLHNQYHNLVPSTHDSPTNQNISSHDVMEKRNLNDLESDLTNTTLPDFNTQLSGFVGPESQLYHKDRPWFTRLMMLHEKNLISLNEFFTVLEGVRDSRFPLPLLNILDPGSNPNSRFKDEEIAKRTKLYIIPLCDANKHTA